MSHRESNGVIRRASWISPTVFAEWCLRREVPRWWTRFSTIGDFARITIILPVLCAGIYAATFWPSLRHAAGISAFHSLVFFVAATLFIGGGQYAARAVIWELSPEMRDLVRLTGIDATTLLWTKTLARWWTVGWSALLILPLVFFVITLGGVSYDRMISASLGMLLIVALTSSFGMLAGVIASDAKNPEKTAASMTLGGLYIYNVSFTVFSSLIYWGADFVMGGVTLEMDRLCQTISQSGPWGSLMLALFQPSLFEPKAVSYWGHFLTAGVGFVAATFAMNHKFQCSPSVENVTFAQRLGQLTRLLFQLGSRRKQIVLKKSRANSSCAGLEADRDQAAHVQAAQSEHDEPPKVSRIGRRPPRCTVRPFRWKDIYILSDSRNLINYWSLFHVAIACGLVTLLITVMDARERHIFAVVYACIAYAGWWFIIAIRFDALLTAEFRERTWGSLMLLPVDAHHMLVEKVVAAFWEQRFALLPVAIAVVSLLMWGTAQSFMVFVMTVIIASLVSAILCQMTCITQLISKNWWIGPAQIIGFTTVGGVVISIWISCGPVPGFILSALALGIVVVFVQKVIVDPLVNNWVEP